MAASPPAPASTGPNGLGTFWQITNATRYAANCTGPCRPGELVMPNMAASGASISVSLVAPEIEYTPRINQVDFSVSKRFQFGAVRVLPKTGRLQLVQLGRLHECGLDAVRRADVLRPSVVLQGRIIRIGADVRW